MPECISKSTFGEPVHSVDLLLHIAGSLVVILLRTSQIDGFMRDIKVAADNNRLFYFQILQLCKKRLVPFLPVAQPGKFGTGIGHIYIHQEELIKLQAQHSALGIMFADSDILNYVQRPDL